jgi:uncharacterized membrane protein
MAIAVTALVGLFISVYLLLYRLGLYGEIVCGSGSCEIVQASEYALFLGLPVAGWGVAWYAAVFLLAFLSTQPRYAAATGLPRLLFLLAAGGLVFSAYLTYVELFVLDAICQWCVASAGLTLVIFLLAIPRSPAPEAGPETSA